MESLETVTSSQYSSSSRTGSARSTKSGATAHSQDFKVDNAMSPIDLEGRIQTERLTSIMDEILYKTKIVICLPHFITEYATLSSVLSPEHMNDLLVIFEQHESPIYSSVSLLNRSVTEDLQSGKLTLKERISPELSHMMYILSSYPALGAKVEEMIKQIKHEYAGKKLPAKVVYLEALEEFRELMLTQMETSAAEELGRKICLRNLINSNQQLEKAIQEDLTTLAEEKEAFEKSMKHKSAILASLEKELKTLNNDCYNKIAKQILDSERQMVLATRAHEVKREMLEEEELETCEHYSTMLRTHLAEEKQLRLRRFKAQTQLVSWLQKYDTEMSDKQAELDETTQNYEEEADKVTKLEEKLAEQDAEYLPLMAERDAEYEQEMAEKMMTFLREHAARVIQSAWREVLANRKEKRRLKKLAKKAEAAEMKKKK